MLKSMTAFARFEINHEMGALTWELRSVNHRYLEMSFRLPEELRVLEQAFREKTSARVNRGKLDCQLRYKQNEFSVAKLEVNVDVARSVSQACQQLQVLLVDGAMPSTLDLLRWPGVIKQDEVDPASLHKSAIESLDAALDALIKTREREGDRIQEMLLDRCQVITEIITRVRKRRPQIQQLLRDKLETRLAELRASPDPARLEQELVFMAQKMDVDEELDRLNSHVSEVLAVLKRKEAVGRRLDFLMQELNREANTLGSKSGDVETTQASVDLKVLIEQMREQIQNIE